jgi:hypothetical protein
MVAVLQQGKQVVAVAGAHGKTTTSSLIAYILHRAGLSPTIMLGGEARDLGTNALPGDGPALRRRGGRVRPRLPQLPPVHRGRHQRRAGPPRRLRLLRGTTACLRPVPRSS